MITFVATDFIFCDMQGRHRVFSAKRTVVDKYAWRILKSFLQNRYVRRVWLKREYLLGSTVPHCLNQFPFFRSNVNDLFIAELREEFAKQFNLGVLVIVHLRQQSY